MDTSNTLTVTDRGTEITTEFRIKKMMYPAMIAQANQKTKDTFLQFLLAEIENVNTRKTYSRVIYNFMDFFEAAGVRELATITPNQVALYIRALATKKDARGDRLYSDPTIKLHLAAVRRLFDYLVVNQVMAFNPAAPVRGPKYAAETGKTQIMSPQEARHLLDSINTGTLIGLRDQALIAVLLYAFARVS